MARNRRGKGLQNVTQLRRKLRRMPDAVTEPIQDALKEGAERIEQDAKANASKISRSAVDGIRTKVSRDGLSAKVGVIGKRAMKKAWFLVFFEHGTVDRVQRSTGRQTGRVAKQPIFTPAFQQNSDGLVRKVGREIDRALARVAKGDF